MVPPIHLRGTEGTLNSLICFGDLKPTTLASLENLLTHKPRGLDRKDLSDQLRARAWINNLLSWVLLLCLGPSKEEYALSHWGKHRNFLKEEKENKTQPSQLNTPTSISESHALSLLLFSVKTLPTSVWNSCRSRDKEPSTSTTRGCHTPCCIACATSWFQPPIQSVEEGGHKPVAI